MPAKVHRRVALNNLRRATSSSSPLVLVPGLAAISAGIFHLPCTVHELCGTLELPEPRCTEIETDRQGKHSDLRIFTLQGGTFPKWAG